LTAQGQRLLSKTAMQFPIRYIMNYVKTKTCKNPIFSSDGDSAPYNGEVEYTINVDRAKALGFMFTPLHNWIYDLLDYYIEEGMGKL
jgi:hypothetical protein